MTYDNIYVQCSLLVVEELLDIKIRVSFRVLLEISAETSQMNTVLFKSSGNICLVTNKYFFFVSFLLKFVFSEKKIFQLT